MVRARAAALAALAIALPALAPHGASPGPSWSTSTGPAEPLAASPAAGEARPPAAAEDPLLCILDTGIDPGHADFEGRIVAWKDFVGGRPEPYDDSGHGTHVAGVAAGGGASGKPGAAPTARLAVGKVMDDRGHGTSLAAARGIAWCVAQGARVINLSLEEEDCDGQHGLPEAVARARRAGALLVTTAGNGGDERCAIHVPGSLPDALTVGALAGASLHADRVARFSGRGTPGDPIKPDLVAPGAGVRAARAGTRDGLGAMDGTSMAAPLVAGVAALLAAAHPAAGPELLARALRASARDGGAPGPDPEWGWGALQPTQALGWLDAHAPGPPAAADGARRQLAVLEGYAA